MTATMTRGPRGVERVTSPSKLACWIQCHETREATV